MYFANNTVIGNNEINTKLIDSIGVMKYPEALKKWGNLASIGVILIKTKQTFKTLTISDLAKKYLLNTGNFNVIYALNGYFFTDSTLKISEKAIIRVEIIKNLRIDNTDTSNRFTCMNIWTATKEDIKRDESIPKLCRGVNSH